MHTRLLRSCAALERLSEPHPTRPECVQCTGACSVSCAAIETECIRVHHRFMERGYKAAQERLVKTAVEGHAWQADHIVPVYRGGGRCGLENLRTLCTPCHADVTKQQAKDRAAMRCAARPVVTCDGSS